MKARGDKTFVFGWLWRHPWYEAAVFIRGRSYVWNLKMILIVPTPRELACCISWLFGAVPAKVRGWGEWSLVMPFCILFCPPDGRRKIPKVSLNGAKSIKSLYCPFLQVEGKNVRSVPRTGAKQTKRKKRGKPL